MQVFDIERKGKTSKDYLQEIRESQNTREGQAERERQRKS